MTTQVYSHTACAGHDPGPFHGMGPARLQAVASALSGPGFGPLAWETAGPIPREILELVHLPAYVDAVLAPVPEGEERAFDFETSAMGGTAHAALHAAGLVAEAVRAVLAGEARNAFCIVSPGGHHAEAETAQGFCFFNNVAVAAALAQDRLGVRRVAVLDFDAHHGNGTQSLFWSHADRMLVSLHEDTPLSGLRDERGAANNILNIPLPHGSDGAVLRDRMTGEALPAIEAFRPELLLVSAGFDMHRDDPLGRLDLDVPDYGWLGEELAALADRLCGGSLVAVLEGGYSLEWLGPSAAAFVAGLMEERT